jgi:hypothetical protein
MTKKQCKVARLKTSEKSDVQVERENPFLISQTWENPGSVRWSRSIFISNLKQIWKFSKSGCKADSFKLFNRKNMRIKALKLGLQGIFSSLALSQRNFDYFFYFSRKFQSFSRFWHFFKEISDFDSDFCSTRKTKTTLYVWSKEYQIYVLYFPSFNFQKKHF